MCACTLYFQKLESLAYISVADGMGLPLFKFVQRARKDASFLTAVRDVLRKMHSLLREP